MPAPSKLATGLAPAKKQKTLTKWNSKTPPGPNDLVSIGVPLAVAHSILPATGAALFECLRDNVHWDPSNVKENFFMITQHGTYMNLLVIGRCLNLRIPTKKGEKKDFDSHDYFKKRNTHTKKTGPSCVEEIVHMEPATQKGRQCVYALRLDPGLELMLFDPSNERLFQKGYSVEHQRIMWAKNWIEKGKTNLWWRLGHTKESLLVADSNYVEMHKSAATPLSEIVTGTFAPLRQAERTKKGENKRPLEVDNEEESAPPEKLELLNVNDPVLWEETLAAIVPPQDLACYETMPAPTGDELSDPAATESPDELPIDAATFEEVDRVFQDLGVVDIWADPFNWA